MSFKAKTLPGDIVLVGVNFLSKFSSITDSQGNTFQAVGSQLSTSGDQIHTALFYAVNIVGGADKVTIHLATQSSILEVYLAEYSGVNETTPIDAQAGATGPAGAISSGYGNTTVAGDLIFGYCTADSTCTTGSTFTTRSTFNANFMEDETASNPGSYAATGSANSSWTMHMVALRPAPAAAPEVITSPAIASASVRNSSSSGSAGGANPQAVAVASPQNVVSGISCTPKVLNAGSHASCELTVAVSSVPAQVTIISDSQQVKVPPVVSTRANQGSLTFQVNADPAATQQSVTLTASAGGSSAQGTIQVMAASGPILTVPDTQMAKPGSAVQFTVAAVDPAGSPVQMKASNIPDGATFEPASGGFAWKAGAIGTYKVTFTATDAAGQIASAPVVINVSSGSPTLQAIDHLCSPGAVGALSGTWLAQPGESLSDVTGASMALGSTKVSINGQYAPVLLATAASVQFLCPAVDAGRPLEISVETADGATTPLNTVMQSASPWIFTLNAPDQRQGLVSFANPADLAMARNSRVVAHPAQPGDELTIRGTGFGSVTDVASGAVSVQLDGLNAEVESISPVPGHAGVYTVVVTVPAGTVPGDAVPLQIQVTGSDGKIVSSNAVSVAVEQAR